MTRSTGSLASRWWLLCIGLGLVWLVLTKSSSQANRRRDHPILKLIDKAEREHARIRREQPKSYREATKMYRRQHGRDPPPGYDQWFEISQRLVGACRPAGYQDMYDNLEIWHALSAREIRNRNEQLLGANLIGRVSVRNGEVRRWDDAEKESPGSFGSKNDARNAMEQMLEAIVKEWDVHLPDIDMWVNGFDEARVILPYEDKQYLLSLAKQGRGKVGPDSSFGGKVTSSSSIRDHCKYPELQCPTSWASLRAACPPNSLARTTPLAKLPGSHYEVSQNYTARFTTPNGHFLTSPDLEQSTWCDQPDLQHLHAMHIYPLNWPYTNQPYPVFSCSKVLGYEDILFPAWWYWKKLTPYKSKKDPAWKNKKDELYWIGSNTGGATMGKLYKGWLRSRAVAQANLQQDDNRTTELQLTTLDGSLITTKLLTRAITFSLFNVALTRPDHGDEDSKLLQYQDPDLRWSSVQKFERQYGSKIVLDLDGTAYSGRFNAIMRSKSAVFKATLFREAITHTLVPWYHYVPVSIRLAELPSLVTFFLGAQGPVRKQISEGIPVEDKILDVVAHDEELRTIAERGQEWAETCGTREEFMLYTYLLALEWARLLNDDRRGS